MNEEEKQRRKEEFYRKSLERIKRFRLLDDTFFTVCFEGDGACTELVLRILLGRDDLKVLENKTQFSVKNLYGHSVVLDVLATDSTGQTYNIEVQRADKGASPRRARYNSSLLDGQILVEGDAYDGLPETYVIFITENDVLGKGLPLYRIERMIVGIDNEFGDGSHILYVDASHTDESAVGRLMHDFRCAEPEQMHYAVLAERVRYFKEDRKGVSFMCKIMEEVKAEGFEEGREEGFEEGREEGFEEGREEGFEEGREEERELAIARARENARQQAMEMIEDGVLSLEKISQFSRLPLDEVKALAAAL